MKDGQFFFLNVFVGDQARGNPCCVMMREDLANEAQLQKIALDLNAPATCFCRQEVDGLFVKWFAPEGKIDLCGHGALGMAWMWLQELGNGERLNIMYEGGSLLASKDKGRVSIKGAAIHPKAAVVPDWLHEGFGEGVLGYYPSENKHVVLMESERLVRDMKPNWDPLRSSGVFSFAVTAKGKEYDMVSKVFLPSLLILEDFATGSAHMTLAPFWAKRLEKDQLLAFQASRRGGEIHCSVDGNEVELSAQCIYFAQGQLTD